MKYIKLWGIGAMHKTLPFKWEWKVTYEYCPDGQWYSMSETFQNRDKARAFKRDVLYCHQGVVSPIPYTCYRNIKMYRRLVCARWEEYSDSFTWNRGCGTR